VPLPRVLFRSPLNSGLCISETLDLKITDGRLVEGTAKSAWVIAKGDQERIMPLPRKSEVLFEIRKDLEK
jgi:site-specific recombinase XerC